MQISFGREAHKALKNNRLTPQEKQRLHTAIEKFRANFQNPGLNFELLGSGNGQNHHSIRASRELRLILAIDKHDLLMGRPQSVMVAAMGHHDPIYEWSKRQGYHSDVAEGVALNGHSVEGDQSSPFEALQSFEEWQLFLHPHQQKYVKRTFAGEARICGSSGTGKTVIGLHRMSRLAQENPDDRFLVTAFHTTLVRVLETMFAGLPEPPPNVDFLTLHKIAKNYCNIHDRNGFAGGWIEKSKVEEAFEIAFKESIAGTALETCTRDYIREEIGRVIKGRAAGRDEYLASDRFQRVGRVRGFKRRDREICWKCLERWDQEMARLGTTSFDNRMQRAMALAEQRDEPVYRSALVDEGQDVTAAGMRLIRALVAGSPDNSVPADGLLFLDDKAQQIYPGGFRAHWAHLNFGGRTIHLQEGLRTTRQIAAAAAAVRGQKLVDKSDTDEGAVDTNQYRRNGRKPYLVHAGKKEITTMIEIIKKLQRADFAHSEIGVITHRRKDVETCVESFNGKGVPAVELKPNAGAGGHAAESVKVVTYDSSKGLEFRAVLIPRIDGTIFPLTEADREELQVRLGVTEDGQGERLDDGILDDEAHEKRQLNLDRLYVGMTRARDLLFVISSGEPCEEIQNAQECFDRCHGAERLDFSQETDVRPM